MGNSPNLYRLIRNDGPRKPSVGNVNKESDGTLIPSQEHQPMRWAEHFRERFSRPTAIMCLPVMPASEPMEVDTSPSIENGGDEGHRISYKIQGNRTKWTVSIILQGW